MANKPGEFNVWKDYCWINTPLPDWGIQENEAVKTVANKLSRKEEKIYFETTSSLQIVKNHMQVNMFYKLGPASILV